MPEASDLAVFVYGSLQPGGRNWARYCAGKVITQQPARVRGKLYRQSDGFPALVLDVHCWTRGWLLELADSAALAGFDRLEDYSVSRPPEQNDYQRVRTECFADDPTQARNPQSLGNAWIYVMTPARLALTGAVPEPGDSWTEPKI